MSPPVSCACAIGEPSLEKAGGGGLRWPDEKGAIGPNNLPRMAGGNPNGAKCKKHPDCPFKFCSFSHDK